MVELRLLKIIVFIDYILSVFRTNDRNLFKPIVHIAPIAKHESKGVHLVAITHAGKHYIHVNPFTQE